MSEQMPYELQKSCRFLLFELPDQVLGFQYIQIRKLNWSFGDRKNREFLEFLFDDGTMRVEGNGLRRLFPKLQSDEVFLIRKGSSGEEITVCDIRFEVLSQEG